MIEAKTLKTITTLLLMALTLASSAQAITQKPKRIYITLDVSGSMDGNKYVMANYAAQTIAVFSSPEDIVNIYYLGKRHGIGSLNGYKQLQIPFNRHSGQKTYHEISDLSAFLRDYRPDPNYQDWLFIIGDGDWNYEAARASYDETTRRLSELLAMGTLQLCYLQSANSLDEENAFTTFLNAQNSPMVDVRKSDTTATSVLNNCTYFANKILGFSSTNVQLKPSGSDCITFTSEFPLDRCLLVLQSRKMTSDEIRMVAVECGGRRVNFRVKGNPTTKPLVQQGKPVLNGVVWELDCPQTIPANQPVKICFNQAVDTRELALYPYVDVTMCMTPLSATKETLRESAPGVFKICNHEDRVMVKIITTDKHGHKFPPPLMKRMDVKFSTGGRTVTATYSENDTSFLAVIDMPLDTLSYSSTVESPGYFRRVSTVQTVVKDSSACPPERISLITLPVQQFDAVTFDDLLTGGSFGGIVNDTLFRALASAADFDDVTMKEPDSWMFDAAGLSVDGFTITITQKTKNGLCECAFPDTLYYEVTLRSTHGIQYDGKVYEGFVIPIKVPVDRRGWWSRCWVYLALFAGLLLLLLYLRALRKKHRFGKDSRIKAVSYDRYGREVDDNLELLLRENSFSAWLARWFWPTDEKVLLTFYSPETQLNVVAGDNISVINVPKASIDDSKMKVAGYNPKDDNEKESSPFVKVANNDIIIVWRNTNAKDGCLTYYAGDSDTSRGFNRFTSLLILLALAAETFVIFNLIKSLILFIL
jgi:hypothetical protein